MIKIGIGLLICVFLLCCADPGLRVGKDRSPQLQNGSFSAELNGFQIHYEVHGTGPVLMVVPNSWGITVSGLRAIFGLLEERLTLVYFEARGMGDSQAIAVESDMGLAAVRADFQALRERLGLEKVDAIGWSNGAVNLISLVSEFPESFHSAVFLHGLSSYSAEDAEEFAQRYPKLFESYRIILSEMEDESKSEEERNSILKRLWLDDLFPLSCADPEKGGQMVREVFEGHQFSWRHAMYANKELPTCDFRAQLRQIRIPALVVAGRFDTIPLEKAEEMSELLFDSRLAVFENSGHFSSLEEPEAFKAEVFGFLGVN